MKKLTDKDAILCKNVEEAIAIRNKFKIPLTAESIKRIFHNNKKAYLTKNTPPLKENDFCLDLFKITKASKILNKGVSKKELLRRIENLEKHISDNTEVKLVSQANPEEKSFEWISKTPEIEGIKNEIVEEKSNEIKKELIELSEKWCDEVTSECFYSKEKPLSIREVQVKVNSQEEANECAEIAKDCGYSISKIMSSASSRNDYFSYNFSKGIEGFGFYGFDPLQTEISIQEFRERFGKHKDVVKRDTPEIDWSKAGQLVESTSGKCIVVTDGENNDISFSGINITDGLFEKGKYSNTWYKKSFKLCTEPITLSN